MPQEGCVMTAKDDAYFLDISKDFKPDEAIFIHPYIYRQESDRKHYHDFYELVIVRHGSGEHVTKDGSYAVNPGDVFLIRPGDPHGYNNMHRMELINLLYRPEKLRDLLDELKDTPGYGRFFEADPELSGRYRFRDRSVIDDETMRKVEELVMRLVEEQRLRASGWRLMVRMLFMQVLCLICRTFEKAHRNPDGPDEIIRIIRYLHGNYARRITLSSLAARFGKSVPTLNRLFQSALDRSPIAYLIDLRLEKAAAELRNSTDPVSVVAARCGFGDSNYFSKMFTRQFGSSPRQYRRSGKEG